MTSYPYLKTMKHRCGCKCGGMWRLKNYLKYFYLYFLHIFTIKIFLKNTLLCPWFTKQRKKKARNIKKKKKHTHTQKKQQIFRIKLRKDKFRMFGPHSELISAVPAWFKADFGLFRPFWSVSTILAAGQYSPILAESKPSQRESKKNKNKNKKTQMWHRHAGSCIWPRQMPHPAWAASSSAAAPSQPRQCFKV